VRRFSAEEAETSPGTLMSTGLIAGGSLAGIIIALLVVFENVAKKIDMSTMVNKVPVYRLPALGMFGLMTAALFAVALAGKRPAAAEPGVKAASSENEP
jgi:hypothetical protein